MNDFCEPQQSNLNTSTSPIHRAIFYGRGVGVRFVHRQPTLIRVSVAWALPAGFGVVGAVGRGRSPRYGFVFS